MLALESNLYDIVEFRFINVFKATLAPTSILLLPLERLVYDARVASNLEQSTEDIVDETSLIPAA